MLFAGVATLLQTITIGPVGAALPVVQGTSYAFLPIMIPLVAGKGGAGREATEEEIQGVTFADGFGTAIAGIFGGFPNTSFSQNIGLIVMTSVMSRHIVTFGAVFLIICGLIPKVGAVIRTVPIEVLGGGVIVMFGMIVAAGISMLSDVDWNRRTW